MYFLHEQLSEKDEEYVLHLKKFESFIEQALLSSNEAVKRMKSDCATELSNIEEAFAIDREKFLLESLSHIDQLAEKQQTTETHHIVALSSLYKQNREAVDDAYDTNTEEYNALRDQLEKRIMDIESQLATSRRKYEAQVDYMDYDLRVTTKENKGRSELLRQKKKLLTKYKNQLVHEREVFTETMTLNSKKMRDLGRQCRYAEGKAKSIAAQLEHFSEVDGNRFKSILKMHLDEIEIMNTRILQAERLIYELVLGIRYVKIQYKYSQE
jgi:hypothetical protein